MFPGGSNPESGLVMSVPFDKFNWEKPNEVNKRNTTIEKFYFVFINKCFKVD